MPEAMVEGFNPCFSGTTTYTFSIGAAASSRTKFQSLFFWNHHLYLFIFRHKWPAPKSFNPCFSGTTTYTIDGGKGKIVTESFNPCFSGTTTYTSQG